MGQIDQVEEKLNMALIKRQEWFLEQTDGDLLQNDLELDKDSTDLEIDRHSKSKNKGHHMNIIVQQEQLKQEQQNVKDNLCNIHFPTKKVAK